MSKAEPVYSLGRDLRKSVPMSRGTVVLLLLAASLLEAGGDVLVRMALKGQYQALGRLGLFAAGALVLFSYGWVVNAAPWDFGKLLGLYVVFFFVTAQLLSWLVFDQPPTRGVWLGGALIIGGGLVITFVER
jgi:drug/metabolite transporter (DMT)-like permease